MQNTIDKVKKFKEAMSNYPTGVNVITAIDENKHPFGITVNSFASVSLDPLLILWSIDNNASTYEKFMATKKFAVNMLSESQDKVATSFASRQEDRFVNCEWDYSKHDLPIIYGSMASLQCHVFNKVEAGDHVIMIGKVFQIDVQDKAPLLYHKRKIGAFPSVFHEK